MTSNDELRKTFVMVVKRKNQNKVRTILENYKFNYNYPKTALTY